MGWRPEKGDAGVGDARAGATEMRRRRSVSHEDVVRHSDHPGSHKWRVMGRASLRMRCWAGEYVVFNPLSGQTHLLDIVTGEVLRLITLGSPSVDELCFGISRFLDVDDDGRLTQNVSDILRHLEEAALIEPISMMCCRS